MLVLGVPGKTQANAGYISFINSRFVVAKTEVGGDAVRVLLNIENVLCMVG